MSEPTSDEPWPATKALSVYNVLRMNRRAEMPLSEVLDYLREWFDPRYPEAWVGHGVQQLVAWGFVNMRQPNRIRAASLDGNGQPLRLKRHAEDSELRFG